MKNVALVVATIVLTLVGAELALRYLPLVNLNFRPYYRTDKFSYRHHHKPSAFDDFRVVQSPSPAACAAKPSPPPLKLLFLGDSWVEGGGIGLGVADYVQTEAKSCGCVELINGGAASFSPSIYLLVGEELSARHHPDAVIVNIDETDLMDESLRYRKTSLRDEKGDLERVVPDMNDELWIYGHRALDEEPVYVLRLIEQVYFEKVFLPRLRRLYLGYSDRPGYDQIIGPPAIRSAADAVQGLYGGDYAKFFKWPADPFSHLSDDGYRRYGSASARRCSLGAGRVARPSVPACDQPPPCESDPAGGVIIAHRGGCPVTIGLVPPRLSAIMDFSR
jgi:hypothetical protein